MGRLGLAFLTVLLVLPSLALAAPFEASGGLSKAGDAIFGQNINLGNWGGAKDSALVRGALAIGLGVNIDPVTGQATMSVFDAVLTATLVLPVAGLLVRGLAIGGKTLALTAGRFAARELATRGAEGLLSKGLFGLAKSVGRLGGAVGKAFTVLEDSGRIARTHVVLLDHVYTGVKSTLKSAYVALDLGHVGTWFKTTPSLIGKVKNVVNLFPHINVLTRSSEKGVGIAVTKLHIPTAPLVWGSRSVASKSAPSKSTPVASPSASSRSTSSARSSSRSGR